MRLRRTEFVAAIVFLLTLLSRGALGGPIDPLLRFQVLRSEHFRIYFHQGEDALAQRLADVAERVHRELSVELHARGERRTDVVLLDQAEEANGWATPLPRNTILLNAAAPAGSELIGNTPDWLETVFRHEYTHILHLDRSRGWARVARAVLGRSPVAFPNLWLPQWQIEGLATLREGSDAMRGRPGAGDFRAIGRQDALSGHRLTIDRASGGLVGWPDGQAAYAAGFEFQNYLGERFGSDSLAHLADATAGRLPFFGNGAFTQVFGESVGTLWREAEASRTPAGRVPLDTSLRRVTHQGEIVLGPRFINPQCDGCPRELIYASRTPHGFPTMRIVSTTGENDRALTTRYLGASTAVTPDFLFFDQQELSRTVSLFSDIYAFNRRTGSVQRLTYGSRLQDPDVTASGTRLVAVRESRGQRDLVLADISRQPSGDSDSALSLTNVRILVSEPATQFSAPRFSPDGTRIAVERRRLGQYSQVVVVDAESGATLAAWGASPMRVVTPAWLPDGRAIVTAVSDSGVPFGLVELQLDGEQSQRLTLTETFPTGVVEGAFWPDVSPDGREVAFVAYSAAGYDVYIKPFRTMPAETLSPVRRWSPVEDAEVQQPARPSAAPSGPRTAASPYSPLETLLPTSWTPLLQSDSFQTRLGGFASGADVLGRHAYTVAASWLTQHGYMTSPLPSGPDWSVSYAYTRWQPTYVGSLSRETQFRRLAATASTTAATHAVVRHEAQAGVLWPITRVRQNSRAFVSMVDTRASDVLDDRTVDARLVSARLAFAHDTSRRYGYSISREHGINVGGTVELTRRALGGAADADTMTIDARAYLPGFEQHHVIAVRASAANAAGDNAARQSFESGILSASPSVIDFGSDAVGLFRGVVTDSSHATRLATANVEYRFPLKTIERGYGTLPLMLRTLHMSAFVDVLRAREIGAPATRHAAAVGAELSMDAVVGYSLPEAISVGAAWTMPRRNGERDVRVYVRLGRAF